ncbi:glycosyltransferase family 2 protein [Belliella aquatica]|uniref:N-acetylglucosaminyltransferase n=1 Tax=Belliella aquatica TaxID=1323734 RepID=A0ABQ1MGU5_9BACT|nr:glycosyltransferase [Belliella aquatica]MCH7405045.1 glycosyltransferase family 2 protein [Belliella aquatica]GGC40311.1 chitin synthase [Belliella aquatica]
MLKTYKSSINPAKNRSSLNPSKILTNKERIQSKIQTNRFNNFERLILTLTFSSIILAIISLFYFEAYFDQLHIARLETGWGYWTFIISISLLGIKLIFLSWLFYLHKKYKPIESVSDEDLPFCTVIVPAYNEGEMVYKTLKSLTDSLYPIYKLQIITIDDGSKDDTWKWMQKAKGELGNRITICQQPKNMGKRAALHRAFLEGTGEVFVTVDSDSLVKKNTLRNLVSPFVINESCGAVAGNVMVLNKESGLIPKMLNVSFAFSFEFIRSAQSVLGSVLCTPGALAAYRKTAVMNCLNDWVNQEFMGKKTDIGEDRAMTNMILKQGYEVVFQKNAEVYTNIPEKYNNLRKMFTRWERSNVRENIMLTKFAFSDFREGNKYGTRLLLFNQWLKVLLAYPALALLITLLIIQPFLVLSSIFIGLFVFSSLPALFYLLKRDKHDAVWAYSYAIFYTFSLFWIPPYAIATASRSGWLTRTMPNN